MPKAEPVFYFSLPRLFERWRGGCDARTEMNWTEANAVGATVHAIFYVFAAHLFLGGLARWQQMILLLPLVSLVWIGWLVLLYLNTLILRLLRLGGLLRDLPDNRAQSFLVGVVATAFAIELIRAGSWLRFFGALWLAAVCLNLAAAAVLALLPRNESAAA